MEIKTQKLKKQCGAFKRLVDIDRNVRPDKDMRKSDRLNTSVKNDNSMYGIGAKRDPKTGRMLPRYGEKNVRDDSIQYDRARYKNNPQRNLYSTALNTLNRCLMKGIPLDEDFYEEEHTFFRDLPANKNRPAIPKGEPFKDIVWGLRKYLVEMWEQCAKTDYKCPCCDKEMVINAGKGRKAKHSRTLDRINPLKGYIKGNIRFICDFCNKIMSSATPEEVYTVAMFMKNNG